MKCITFHSWLLPLHSSELKHHRRRRHHHHHHHHKLLCLTNTFPHRLCFGSPSPVMSKALPNSIVIAASSSSYPPKPVELSVFLQTSALLFFLYFTANFIVPELISKHFGFEEIKKDQKDDSVEATEDR